MPPDDVRITKADAPIPVAAEIAPVVQPVVEAAPVVAAAEVAPVVEAPVAEVMPTAQPTLFEAAEARAAEKAKPAEEVAAEAKPVEAEPKAEEKPAAEEKTAEEKPAEKAAEDKPVEGEKPAVEAAKPEVVAEAAPVEPKPIPFEYVLPEGIVLPEKDAVAVNAALSAFAANPGDKAAQQNLIDLHYNTLIDGIKQYNAEAHRSFAAKRQEWQKQVMDHPELGGGNHDAAMQAIAYVRDNFVSSHPRGSKQYEASKKGLEEMMHLTGAGDNPYFLELMHNVSVRLNEPSIQATQEIKPIIPSETGRASIYKHPTSNIRR